MKTNIIIVFVVMVFISITGCTKESETTAKEFFNAMESRDIVVAKKLATDDSHEFIDFFIESSDVPKEKRNHYKIIRVVENENKATVTYEAWPPSMPEAKQTDTVAMINENGNWKVQIYGIVGAIEIPKTNEKDQNEVIPFRTGKF